MIIDKIVEPYFGENMYILIDEETKKCAVVDPRWCELARIGRGAASRLGGAGGGGAKCSGGRRWWCELDVGGVLFELCTGSCGEGVKSRWR